MLTLGAVHFSGEFRSVYWVNPGSENEHWCCQHRRDWTIWYHPWTTQESKVKIQIQTEGEILTAFSHQSYFYLIIRHVNVHEYICKFTCRFVEMYKWILSKFYGWSPQKNTAKRPPGVTHRKQVANNSKVWVMMILIV